MKRRWILALPLFLLFAVGQAWAQISDIGAAINKAGRERMLAQRIAKAYLQLGQAIETERSMRVLYSSISLFDRQLVELKNYAPTPAIRDTYQQLEKSWMAYKDVLVGATPNRDGARKVLELSEEVMALANMGTVQLEKHAASSSGRLVNLAGRQRMVSQRMAKFYLASAWGVGEGSHAELDKSRKEFGAALQELMAAPENTQPVREGLELVKQQWFFFDNALSQRPGGDKRLVMAVATASERILEEMERVVSLYEKLAAR